MKLLTWNILSGGSKARIPGVVQNLVAHDPDVIVLTEFWSGKGDQMADALRELGWPYQVSSNPPPKEHGILLASRLPFAPVGFQASIPHRAVEVDFDNLTVLGVHIPDAGGKWDKLRFWADVLEYGRTMKDKNVVIVGDFNTGLDIDAEGTPFVCQEHMKELVSLGWTDAWRTLHPGQRDFTWFSSGARNGFRLDYAFLSPALRTQLVSAEHSHVEREQKLSDHSALVVELSDDSGGVMASPSHRKTRPQNPRQSS